ncbi:outer membrane protein assembly factor BamB [Luteimonas lutimaris]|uniref:Outer membrane protein assembly factor BamB n=1 Tax=Luteimonas lutimaris TaxID=698645 RepID=A0ABP7MC09_9GAMM|nr:outer membrane protein assembly factor BamB [Luteimonas sp.]
MNHANTIPARARPSGLVLRLAVGLTCVAMLAGCSTIKGWFSGKNKDRSAEPSELTEFAPSAKVAKLWSANAGKGEGLLGARQAPAIADGRVYAAAVKGGVRAFDLQSGAKVWTYDSDLSLSGGPGAADGVVAVGSLEGDVIALDAATGAEKWRAKVVNEVIAAPAVGQGLVIVHSNDGRVTAFDAASGERRWFWNHEMPLLTVRGNDAPSLGPGYAFVGNDDGTVTALSLADGRELWTQVIGQPDGRTELERMADVDGTPVLDGAILYASSFKRQTLAIEAPSGRPIWARDSGGLGRVGVASDRVVVTDPDGIVWALDKASGSALWSQPAMTRRSLTAPAVQGDYAVVGDYDGYLHWLKLDTGELAARTRASRDALRATPVVVDGILVVQDTDGDISAYQVQ